MPAKIKLIKKQNFPKNFPKGYPAEEGAEHEAEHDGGDEVDDKEEQNDGRIALGDDRGVLLDRQRHAQQRGDQADADQVPEERVHQPRGPGIGGICEIIMIIPTLKKHFSPMQPVLQSHHSHRLLQPKLLLQHNVLGEVDRGIDEAEHENEREHELQRKEELIVHVGRIRKTLNVQANGVDKGFGPRTQRYGDRTTQIMLEVKKARLVVVRWSTLDDIVVPWTGLLELRKLAGRLPGELLDFLKTKFVRIFGRHKRKAKLEPNIVRAELPKDDTAHDGLSVHGGVVVHQGLLVGKSFR